MCLAMEKKNNKNPPRLLKTKWSILHNQYCHLLSFTVIHCDTVIESLRLFMFLNVYEAHLTCSITIFLAIIAPIT